MRVRVLCYAPHSKGISLPDHRAGPYMMVSDSAQQLRHMAACSGMYWRAARRSTARSPVDGSQITMKNSCPSERMAGQGRTGDGRGRQSRCVSSYRTSDGWARGGCWVSSTLMRDCSGPSLLRAGLALFLSSFVRLSLPLSLLLFSQQDMMGGGEQMWLIAFFQALGVPSSQELSRLRGYYLSSRTRGLIACGDCPSEGQAEPVRND